MREAKRADHEGGYATPPFPMSKRRRIGLFFGLVVCLCLSSLSFSQGESRFRTRLTVTTTGRRSPTQRPVGRTLAKPLARAPQDARAIALLKRMVRPEADYVGEQVTQSGGRQSQQSIKGDTKGRTLRVFHSPAAWDGDLMFTGPSQYRYYHHRTNTVDVAFWPTQWNEHEKRLVNAIRSGRVSAALVGQETIAGRNAAIVALSAGARQMKFWIDVQTGIPLKNEIITANGPFSTSYMTAITIGPAANVRPMDFERAFPAARINPLFPSERPVYRTLQEAEGRLPFKPLEPGALPSGFQLTGIWVFGAAGNRMAGQPSVLMRYSDGVTTFSLYQRIAPPNANPAPIGPRMYQRPIQRWPVKAPDGLRQVLFIGHLTPEQAQALHDSLH